MEETGMRKLLFHAFRVNWHFRNGPQYVIGLTKGRAPIHWRVGLRLTDISIFMLVLYSRVSVLYQCSKIAILN